MTFYSAPIAQKILACVYSLGKNYGLNYVAQILKGAKTSRIFSNGHNTLSTNGTIQEYSIDQLKELIKQLVDLKYLSLTKDMYPILSLTEKGTEALKNKTEIKLTKPPTTFELLKMKAEKNRTTIEQTLELIEKGFSFTQIASLRNMTESKVVEHIELATLLGKKVDVLKFINDSKLKTIMNTFEELKLNRLTPVKEKLGDEYSYLELRLARAHMRGNKMI